MIEVNSSGFRIRKDKDIMKKPIPVYKMRIAMYLIEKGHNVIHIMPNPKIPKYNMWVFEEDETFNDDLNEAIELERGRRNGSV